MYAQGPGLRAGMMPRGVAFMNAAALPPAWPSSENAQARWNHQSVTDRIPSERNEALTYMPRPRTVRSVEWKRLPTNLMENREACGPANTPPGDLSIV